MGAWRKHPSGGKKTGKNPTDRAKGGVKRSLLVEAAGLPVGLAVDGANRNDMKMVRETLESIPIERPEPTDDKPQGMCMDKGYDYDEVREVVVEFAFTAHICSRGEEAKTIKKKAGFKARRWVVERTHSWMNKFRGILIRWNKKPENYVAMLHFAFAIMAYRSAGLFG
jgi:putative transposase